MSDMSSARSFSFEFYPPRTPEGEVKLRAQRAQLVAVRPAFMSCTFGAGGSTREGTWKTVMEIHGEGHAAAPHIACIGAARDELRGLIHAYRDAGIRRLVAVRGDMPSGAGAVSGDFAHAAELVELIRAESGNWFHIEVAAYPEMHPQARSPQDDLRHFIGKVRAGADSAITQYFYNADAYFRLRDDAAAAGCDIAIVPGIMPITNYAQLARFSDNCGAELPRWIRLKLASFGDDRASIRAFGLDVVTQLCERLLAGGAPGLHFFTMNHAGPTLELWRRIGLPE
jgi:methylenetetrahydrofolate reductase (NADPH)